MAKRGFQGAVLRGFGARDHVATLAGRELLAPGFLRIHLHSDTLFREVEAVPTAWLRFWFPDPDGAETEHQRAYTISAADEDRGAFSVDFVLHEPAGPASVWATSAEIGTSISLTSLGSSKFEVPEEPPAGYLLVGDSAAVPAISAILRTVPPETPVELYLEEHEADDRLIPLPAHPRLRTHWVPRRGPQSLANAIEARDWSDWFAWAACESGSLKHLRARLKEEFGFPKSEQYLQAYWMYGRAMGKLRASATEEVTPAAAEDAPVSGDGMPVPGGAAPAAEPAATAAADVAADAPAGSADPGRGRWRAQAAGRLLRPLRPVFVLAGVLQALVTLIELAPFVLVTELARLMLAGAPAASLWTVGIWAVTLMVGGVVLSAALLWWLHLVDARFERGLRERLLRKLARLPLGWFDTRGSGQVKHLVSDDTLALHALVTHAVPDAVAAVVAPLAVLGYLFVVDWRLALVLMIPVVVAVFAMVAMMVQSGPKTSQALRWGERMSGEAAGYLDGQPVVRVFGGAAASAFRARLDEYLRFLEGWQRPFVGKKTLMELATRPATALLLIVTVGTLLVTIGAMDPVSLLPFLLLGPTFGSRLLGIGYGFAGIRTGMTAARRVQLTLDETELAVRGDGATAPAASATASHGATTAARVEFERVRFEYRAGVPVIDGVSLVLEPGTVTALVGPSGSGKSTLAALLARFHDVIDGSIRIAGDDVRDLSSDELYRRVGFVFQRTELVHGTVHENIALAVPEASRARVEDAARAAQLHDRVLRMPSGYDTILGPDAALSGGERQRLAIARAILADPAVLVLDEATAFADPESEYLVQRALNRLTADRTVLVIAHRLRTVTGADQIVVLERGRIAERGGHDALLAAGGPYRRLWDAGTETPTEVPR